MTFDLPTTISEAVVGRSNFISKLATTPEFFVPSINHGRSVSSQLTNGNWLSIKGCGWTLGPPWVYLSPKDPELCFGLMDEASAIREIKVSSWLESRNIPCARSREMISLNHEELAMLGIDGEICFRNNIQIKPTALLTESRSAYRIKDLVSAKPHDAVMELQRHAGSKDAVFILRHVIHHLLSAIVAYQKLGCVNDTLGAENVDVAGEITDYEWLYVPGIPMPDGSTDINLIERQMKEAFYFAETMIVLASSLNMHVSIRDVSKIALKFVSSDSIDLAPIVEQLMLFANE